MNNLDAAIDCYREGGVFLYPTTTLWGLGGDGRQESVLARIQHIKGRQSHQPFLVLVPSIESVLELATHIPQTAQKLMDQLWPGDLTLLLPARKDIPSALVGTEGLVGLRLPSHPVAKAISQATQGWLVSTSANPSGHAPPIALNQVSESIREQVDCVVNAPPQPSGKASSIVSVNGNDDVCLIRAGSVQTAVLEATVGHPIPSV